MRASGVPGGTTVGGSSQLLSIEYVQRSTCLKILSMIGCMHGACISSSVQALLGAQASSQD